jgi:hypothetical protein
MAKGNLKIQITDTAGEALRAHVDIDLQPMSGELGSGGEGMTVSANLNADTQLTITGITCRGGSGTMYRLLATAPHFRPYGFFQLIQEGDSDTAGDDVEFWVKPGDVTDILAPKFDELPAGLRAILSGAQMVVDKPEDRDLVGNLGPALYGKLGPLRKAGLLNIAKKAGHATSDNCFPQIGSLLICRQDRFFAMVDASLPGRLRASERYKTAPSTLHQPLDEFEMTGESFKTRDPHANLQLTFQRRLGTGELAADIDIDESSGIEHGFEVIRNALFRSRTNPYLIREFMLMADPIERTLDPGYRFVF